MQAEDRKRKKMALNLKVLALVSMGREDDADKVKLQMRDLCIGEGWVLVSAFIHIYIDAYTYTYTYMYIYIY